MSSVASPAPRETYSQILRSTILIGGASVINVAFSIIRAKAMAVLLGPAGVGLMGLYYSLGEVIETVAGLGVSSSGVRQIAEAEGAGDRAGVARTARIIRWTSIVLAVIGGALLVVASGPVASLTFDDPQQASGVALLGLAVALRVVAGGQSALIQGMRHIGDMARLAVFTAFLGTAISIPLIFMFGERGIVPSLVAMGAASFACSWWYSRTIKSATGTVSLGEIGRAAAPLLKLGVAFMVSGLLSVGGAYCVRLIVLRTLGFEAVGHYQAAWSLGGVYAAFILHAMATDFYPRLTAVNQINSECNRLVNEQAQISILLAAPGVIFTLAFAPLVMTIFYSAEFQPAANLLRWICMGMMLRIVAWPLGFIILAKGAQKTLVWTEIAAAGMHAGLAWLLTRFIGLDGAGAAFFFLYVWHGFLVYLIARRFTDFRWSRANLKYGALLLPLTGLVFLAFQLLPTWQATILGTAAGAFSAFFSLKVLLALHGYDSLLLGIKQVASRALRVR